MNHRTFLWIFPLWLLVFWAHPWEMELKLDPMTYSAIARKIVETGEWTTLHYARHAFADFYQHPPLAMWMQAGVFHLFGATEITARFLPSLLALGTLILVYLLTLRITASRWHAFLSVLVLLTSTRFTKYASDFFLDGPLAFWLLSGVYAFDVSRKSVGRRTFVLGTLGFGLALAAALLTKGLTALALPGGVAAAATVSWISGRRNESYRSFGILGAGAGIAMLSLAPWLLWADGLKYLEEYWATSVAARVSAKNWRDQFTPVLHILKIYWPWIPLFVWGSVKLFRNPGTFWPLQYIWFPGVVIVAAFSWVGHSIEHYFVPFYVFAAPIAAWPLAEWNWFKKREAGFMRGFAVAYVALAVALATLPIRVHGNRAPEMREALRTAVRLCPKDAMNEVIFTAGTGYLWHTAAQVQWETPWEFRYLDRAPEKATRGDFLITPVGTEIQPESGWKRIPHSDSSFLQLHQGPPYPCRELR